MLISALALLVLLGVVFRKAGYALVWYDEVAAILLAWLTFYGAALAALHRAHIGFPRLVQNLRGKSRWGVMFLREFFVVGFFVLVAWTGTRLMAVLTDTYLVSLPWMPARLVYSAIPVGAVLFIIAELLAAWELWQRETAA